MARRHAHDEPLDAARCHLIELVAQVARVTGFDVARLHVRAVALKVVPSEDVRRWGCRHCMSVMPSTGFCTVCVTFSLTPALLSAAPANCGRSLPRSLSVPPLRLADLAAAVAWPLACCAPL